MTASVVGSLNNALGGEAYASRLMVEHHSEYNPLGDHSCSRHSYLLITRDNGCESQQRRARKSSGVRVATQP